MSVSEIKNEIEKMLDEIPDNVLVELYDSLKHYKNASQEKIKLSDHLKKIFSEDHQLLQRLAE